MFFSVWEEVLLRFLLVTVNVFSVVTLRIVAVEEMSSIALESLKRLCRKERELHLYPQVSSSSHQQLCFSPDHIPVTLPPTRAVFCPTESPPLHASKLMTFCEGHKLARYSGQS